MMAIFYKTILRLNYLKSFNKIELPVQLPPEVPPHRDCYRHHPSRILQIR